MTIYGSDNTPLGSERVQPDGSFTVTLNPPQTNGEILTAIVKDPANQTSPPATTLAPDTTPPQPAENLEVSDDGTTVTGTAEPGSTVTIRDPTVTLLAVVTPTAREFHRHAGHAANQRRNANRHGDRSGESKQYASQRHRTGYHSTTATHCGHFGRRHHPDRHR